MNITAAQRRYLLIYQSLVPCVMTVFVCGVIGVIDYRGRSTLPVWGLPQSVAVDLTATSFLLPWLTCLIATPLVRRDVRRGVVAGVSHLPRWMRRFDQVWPVRALLCGLTGLLSMGTMVSAVLMLLPLNETSVATFLAVKLVIAGIASAVFTPAIALLAMHDG